MKDLYIKFYQIAKQSNIDDVLNKKLQNSGFLLNVEKTEWYRSNLPKEEAFVIEMENNKYSPLLFFIKFDKNQYKLVNMNLGSDITDDDFDNEYNSILDSFLLNVKRNIFFKPYLSDDSLDITKIVSSKICRDKLLNLITAFPNSYHPFDIKRMDQIIWSIYRYSRKDIDLNDLNEHLNRYEHLDADYIKFLIDRIRSGLQLLYINSNQYKY